MNLISYIYKHHFYVPVNNNNNAADVVVAGRYQIDEKYECERERIKVIYNGLFM